MDLILWRHAEAVDDETEGADLGRSLTARGEKQAARMAAWLDRQLPEGARILVSPARRTEQTAQALERKYKVCPELGPEHTEAQLLELVHWPRAKGVTLVVGHQPALGRAVAELLAMPAASCTVRKGAVWWLRHRLREGATQTILLAVLAPDLL